MDKPILESARKIKHLYKNLSYFDQYGTSIIICIVLLTILFWIHGYYTIMTNVQPIKDNWLKYRCNPKVIPFAGLINKPDDKTATQFTQDNFTQCVQEMLKPITKRAVSPFDYMTSSFLKVFQVILAAIQQIRELTNSIREKLAIILKDIMGRLINFLVPIQQIIIAFKDTMAKVVGIMQASINTGVGSILAMKSVLGVIVTSAIQVLLILVAVLIALIIIMVIFFFFWPPLFFYAAALVGTYTSFYLTIVGLLLFIIAFLQINLGIQQDGVIPGLPDVPRMCFDKDTPVVLLNKTTKPFCEVCVGDVLSDGGIVTATLKLDARGLTMYDLNGVIVSGTHAVKYNNKWVFVYDHPQAKLLDCYKEPYIYCMNTTTKQFTIKDTIFIDWDEIYDDVKVSLDKTYEKEHGVVPTSLDYIHEYYDGGFEEDVEIDLESGDTCAINKIPVCLRLPGGVVVLGIVKIDKTRIKNTANIYKNIDKPNNLAKNTDVVYHLLTNKGYFYVGGKKVNGYNDYIDSRI
jgi:hypothetical protein